MRRSRRSGPIGSRKAPGARPRFGRMHRSTTKATAAALCGARLASEPAVAVCAPFRRKRPSRAKSNGLSGSIHNPIASHPCACLSTADAAASRDELSTSGRACPPSGHSLGRRRARSHRQRRDIQASSARSSDRCWCETLMWGLKAQTETAPIEGAASCGHTTPCLALPGPALPCQM